MAKLALFMLPAMLLVLAVKAPAATPTGDAKRGGDLGRAQAERRRYAAGGGQRAKDGRRVKARRMRSLRCDKAQTAHQLRAGRDAEEQAISAEPLAFARGEGSGNDHGACVNRTAFERVVEVLAVRGGAVDQRGADSVERAAVTDRGAAAAAIHAGERRLDVIGVAGGHAQAENVEKKTPHGLAYGGRKRRGLSGGQPRSQFFSERRHAALADAS